MPNLSVKDYQKLQHIRFKVWLIENETSQRKLAQQLGVTVQYLCDVLRGRRPGRRLRRRLVEECGVPVHLAEPRTVMRPAITHVDTELKVLLLQRGLSIAALARQMGITPTYLINIVNGKRKAPRQRKRLIEEFAIPPQLMKEAA